MSHMYIDLYWFKVMFPFNNFFFYFSIGFLNFLFNIVHKDRNLRSTPKARENFKPVRMRDHIVVFALLKAAF